MSFVIDCKFIRGESVIRGGWLFPTRRNTIAEEHRRGRISEARREEDEKKTTARKELLVPAAPQSEFRKY
jgi:hypothetical protein